MWYDLPKQSECDGMCRCSIACYLVASSCMLLCSLPVHNADYFGTTLQMLGCIAGLSCHAKGTCLVNACQDWQGRHCMVGKQWYQYVCIYRCKLCLLSPCSLPWNHALSICSTIGMCTLTSRVLQSSEISPVMLLHTDRDRHCHASSTHWSERAWPC